MNPEQIEVEGMRLSAPARSCDTCPQDALYFIQRARVVAFCPVCYERRQTPLLAQCAALLDSLLGGPVAANGIVDEMRRVRAALKEQGW